MSGAPGTPEQGADTLVWCCTEADLSAAEYWRDRQPIPVPDHLRDPALQDALLAACDRLAGLPAATCPLIHGRGVGRNGAALRQL